MKSFAASLQWFWLCTLGNTDLSLFKSQRVLNTCVVKWSYRHKLQCGAAGWRMENMGRVWKRAPHMMLESWPPVLFCFPTAWSWSGHATSLSLLIASMKTSLPLWELYSTGHIMTLWNLSVCVCVSHSVMSNSLWSHELWPFPSPRDLHNCSDPGIESGSSALQADYLPSEPPGKHLQPVHAC